MHSEYRTPKRRHSSLFQRMQEEIQKISRKLSAVKASARPSSNEKVKSLRKDTTRQFKDFKEKTVQGRQKAKLNIFQTKNYQQIRKNIRFDQFPQTSVIETVRIKRLPENDIETSPLSGKKTLTSKTLKRRQNFVSVRQNQDDKIIKLQQQNEELSMQVKKLEGICADQSYRLGYASAYFDQKCKKLEEQKQQFQKENIYLQKLCEHYKSKSKKYKHNLKEFSGKGISEYQDN